MPAEQAGSTFAGEAPSALLERAVRMQERWCWAWISSSAPARLLLKKAEKLTPFLKVGEPLTKA